MLMRPGESCLLERYTNGVHNNLKNRDNQSLQQIANLEKFHYELTWKDRGGLALHNTCTYLEELLFLSITCIDVHMLLESVLPT